MGLETNLLVHWEFLSKSFIPSARIKKKHIFILLAFWLFSLVGIQIENFEKKSRKGYSRARSTVVYPLQFRKNTFSSFKLILAMNVARGSYWMLLQCFQCYPVKTYQRNLNNDMAKIKRQKN